MHQYRKVSKLVRLEKELSIMSSEDHLMAWTISFLPDQELGLRSGRS